MKIVLFNFLILISPVLVFAQPDTTPPDQQLTIENRSPDEVYCMQECWMFEEDAKDIYRETSYSQQIRLDTVFLSDGKFVVLESPVQTYEETYTVIDTLRPRGIIKYIERLGLCDLTESIIRDIQRCLYTKGFYSVSSTGVYDEATQAAFEKYQLENKLPMGCICLDTLKHLGVRF